MPNRNERKRVLPLSGALIVALASLINLSACASDSGDKSDQKASVLAGQALDANTGEPIANAWIFEAIPRGTKGADVRRVSSARWTRTDAAGRYAFKREAGSVLGAIRETRAARYHFYHPSYGLLRGREAGPEPTVFRPSLRDAHLRQADLAAAAPCSPTRGDALDPMAAQLVKLACPPGVAGRFPNGGERTRGALDERGRREGAWEFLREDGSIQARGHYAAGAAVEPWTYFLPGG